MTASDFLKGDGISEKLVIMLIVNIKQECVKNNAQKIISYDIGKW